MISEGRHRSRATGAKLCASKDKGTPFIGIDFVTIENGETISARLFLTEKTEMRTIQSLRYCGWVGTDLMDLSTVSRNEVDLVVEHEEYDNKTRPVVKWINPVGGIAAMPGMDDDSAAALAKAFAQRIPQIEAEAARKKAEKGSGGQLPGGQTESPF